MKFTSKITQLISAGAVSSILVSSLISSAIAETRPQTNVTKIAQALSPEEVNLRAKQIIVRIDGASVGSGSIIEHRHNTYTVLTNWHVMKNQGGYTVQTIDGRKHQVIPNSIKQLGGLDLAVLQFTSDQNYQTAELGDSGSLAEGQTIYFAGYPGELRREDNRYYRFFTANMVGILPRSTENGYSLIYNGEAFPGMSGGPVFNRQGLVVGVHGEANVHALSGGTSNYAIPIASYQQAIANSNNSPLAPLPPLPPRREVVEPQPVAQEPEQKPPAKVEAPETKPESEVAFQPQPEANRQLELSDTGNITSIPPSTEEAQDQPKPEVEPEAEVNQQSELPDAENITSVPPSTGEAQDQPKPEVAPQPQTEAEVNQQSELPNAENITSVPPSTGETQDKPKPEVAPQPKAEAEVNQQSELPNAENIASVPTFNGETQPKPKPESQSQPKPKPEVEPTATSQPESEQPKVAQETPAPEVEVEEVEIEVEEVYVPTTTRKVALVSPKTGIDYTKLRNLLKEGQWSEADLHTYRLVQQIIKSAKQQNKHVFIELKTIAEYSCPDIRTVDFLWKKYSEEQFGFSQQQEVWQSVNQQGDFSTETWRRFATKVGWKKGEVASSSGYLLYDQLDFEPTAAPAGHLPWWFALSDEEQKVMKHLFARCNLNPTLAELEAEEQKNAPDTAKNPDDEDNNDQDKKPAEPEVNKPPKSPK